MHEPLSIKNKYAVANRQAFDECDTKKTYIPTSSHREHIAET